MNCDRHALRFQIVICLLYGKSTVFKAVLGLISCDGGEIKILGKTPQELSEKEKEQMGVVLAESGFSFAFIPVEYSFKNLSSGI